MTNLSLAMLCLVFSSDAISSLSLVMLSLVMLYLVRSSKLRTLLSTGHKLKLLTAYGSSV